MTGHPVTTSFFVFIFPGSTQTLFNSVPCIISSNYVDFLHERGYKNVSLSCDGMMDYIVQEERLFSLDNLMSFLLLTEVHTVESFFQRICQIELV
jgi:hypothetical protein